MTEAANTSAAHAAVTEPDAGARAMAALSTAVTADKQAGTSSVNTSELLEHDEHNEHRQDSEDADAFMDSRICRPQLRDRIVASLQPRISCASTRIEDLADLADAVLADQFAAKTEGRIKRR